jgi:hypothetical protein
MPCTAPPLHVRRGHVSQRPAPSAPKQPKISPWSRRAFRDVPTGPPPAPGRSVLYVQRFWLFQSFGAEARLPVPSAPKASTAQIGRPPQQNSHNSSGIRVSVKPAPPGLPRVSQSCVRAEIVSLTGRGQSFRRSFPQERHRYTCP